MSFAPERLADIFAHGFDTVIDVRSPAEFAEDHIPGAINLPVLDNEERARVGTIYKQESPFKARKIGAALVFANAARHVAGPLATKDGGWRPLVYCWRGGQRSGSFTWMLREIGWRAEVMEGGYRRFRRLVNSRLYQDALPHRLIQIGGYTGSAKTELLAHLARKGCQVLDLERLACHRGSLLGGMPEPQPSQKAFETAIAQTLAQCHPEHPVFVEAESSKIGALIVPPTLWEAMKAAPWIEVTVPLETRARYLAKAYSDVLEDTDALKAKLAPLRFHRGRDTLNRWEALMAAGDRVALCKALAEDHYDPAYRKSMAAHQPEVQLRVATEALDDGALEALATRISDWGQTT